MKDFTETVTATQRVYDGRVVNLRIDTVTLPNGKEGRREVVEHSGAVAVLALNEAGEALLVRQFRLPTGGPLLEVVAGGIDGVEDPATAAARELAEEIGFTPGKLTQLFEAWVAPGYCTEKIWGYLAEDLTPTADAHADADEFVETVTMTLDDATAAILDGRIQDMKSVATILAAVQLLKSR
ncbi:MAG: NUDIX hydrolase [Armatimonas sp.]